MRRELVLEPIFEADLQPEQYAYRADRSALDAVKHVQRLINTGHHQRGASSLRKVLVLIAVHSVQPRSDASHWAVLSWPPFFLRLEVDNHRMS